jgi:transcriptional regulator with GAF, ATPase, and Fis domain
LRKLTEDRLRQALLDVQRLKEQLQEENQYLRRQIRDDAPAHGFVGQGSATRKLLDLLRRVAPTDATVLVQGETGTGKELVCRALHELGERRTRPFISVNCAAIPSSLIESELFGHERGAFTGALSQRAGRFELAEGGTLFLDEIGELPLELQAKLLRVLQEREFERVGGRRTLRSSARIVAATNRNLAELVRAGRFREDLFYRLYVVPVTVPPLRERREDVRLLAEHFLERCQTRWGRRFSGIAPAFVERLERHDWPGTVRELEHLIERAYLIGEGRRLDLRDEPSTAHRPGGKQSRSENLADVERLHIERVLSSTGHRIAGAQGAAAALGLHPNTLRNRMTKLGIRRSR